MGREHLGDAAHAGAADANEVHALDLVLHRFASSRQMSATRFVAPALRSPRALAAIVASFGRSSAPSQSARRCGFQVTLHPELGRAAPDQLLGVVHLMIVRRVRERNEQAGDAHGSELGNRRRTRPANDDVRLRVTSRHVVDERQAFGLDPGVSVGRSQRLDVLLAGLVRDDRPGLRCHQGERARNDVVEGERAEASAEHEQTQRPAAAG